ncbi:MAG TPA: CHAT domain-containing protein [Thermomicrobiales bacterium]|jgi:CHAT domain-containing protein/tetratricopeptide (TPR) repeat protein|nr:CHAT domain-containing protein [Thermomicrobiales bacterium]
MHVDQDAPVLAHAERWPDVAAAIDAGDQGAIALSGEAMMSELEWLAASDPSAAIDAARGAVALADKGGTLSLRLGTRRLLAMAQAHTNQPDAALETCTAALDLEEADTVPVDRARVRLASMQPLMMLGNVDAAIGTGREALAALEAAGAGSIAGRAALNLGATLAMTGRATEALPCFDRAAELLASSPVLLGQVETNRGTALAALDRFREAEAAFARAANLLDHGELAWSAAVVQGNLADLAARQGAVQRSLRHFELSRRLFEQDEAHGDLGRINAEQAALLGSIGLIAESRDLFAEALALLEADGTPSDLVAARAEYAATLIAAGDFAAAAPLLAELHDQLDPNEQPATVDRIRALEAEQAITSNDLARASDLVDQGLAAYADRPVQRLGWRLLRSDLLATTGNLEAARDELRGAMDDAIGAGVTPAVASIHGRSVALARAAGDHAGADDHARAAISAIEAIRGSLQADRLRQRFHGGRLDVYADLYRSLVASDDPAAQHEAFGIGERMRSRSLQDAIAARTQDVEAAVASTPAEDVLLGRLTGHRQWLNWTWSAIAEGTEPDDALRIEIAANERAVATLTDRLATLRSHLALDTPQPLDEIQRTLDPETVVLSYLATGDTLSVQVISHDGVVGIARLADDVTIGALVARLQFQLGRRLATGSGSISASRAARLQRDVDTVLDQLSGQLIAPLTDHFAGRKRLIIVPSGHLHSVPFAALGDRGGTPLVDRFDIVTVPGVNVLAGMGANAGHAAQGTRRLVVGVPDERAPAMGREAEDVARRLPDATLLSGAAATREAVLDQLPHADLVHLACHGRFDSRHPAASGLQLADGWITLDQLLDLQLNDALVLLTGCETGRVRVGEGDELVGIMAALLSAGAGGLVTSLWQTHDEASAVLIQSFYDAWLGGADPVSALRSAQSHTREIFPHPACWAPFVVAYQPSKEL